MGGSLTFINQCIINFNKKCMSRKITVLLMTLSVVMFANAQEYNLFDPADVDANGWIWFDTQEKIDKYIGQANNEDGKIDPNGKIIQLICADFGDYEDSTADPAVKEQVLMEKWKVRMLKPVLLLLPVLLLQ